MRILFATSDGTRAPHFASLIPDAVRAACDVGDVLFSTNATRTGADESDDLWRAAAKVAHDRSLRFVADLELKKTGLPRFKADRPGFAADLSECARLLGVVREAFPGLRVGAYDKLPAVVGMPPGSYDSAEYSACLNAEADALLLGVDFVCPDAYIEDVDPRNYPNLAHFEDSLHFKLDAAAQYRREPLILTHPFYEDGKRAGQYVGPKVWRNMLETVAEVGTPLLWNMTDVGMDVVAKLSAKGNK